MHDQGPIPKYSFHDRHFTWAFFPIVMQQQGNLAGSKTMAAEF